MHFLIDISYKKSIINETTTKTLEPTIVQPICSRVVVVFYNER